MSDPLPPRALEKLGKLVAPPQDEGKTDMEPLGRIAVMKGFLTAAQLEECLRQQKDLQEKGSPLRIGQIFLKRDLISTDQFFQLIEHQERDVRICPSCKHDYDISGHPQGVEVLCLQCGEKTLTPESGDRPDSESSTDLSGGGRWRLGKYELKREIARGGMGVVLEAFDPELKRQVALKILREEASSDLSVQRLHREAAIAAQLHHPNIVGVHEVGVVEDSQGHPTHFIAMDYIQGSDLSHYLSKENPSRKERLRIMEEISRAVAFAHAKGVVHRDIKPANVLVDKEGRVLLTDFGLARAESFLTQLTASQAVMGTPQYMAPEQVEGKTKEIDQRTDIYALGVMLYEILTGKHPFPAETPAKLYEKILREDPVRPTKADDSIDRDLEVICLRAMEKARARRYLTANDFADDLSRFRRGDPILARPTTLFYRMGKKIARRKQILVPVAFVLFAGAILLGLLLGRLGVKENELTRAQELRVQQMRQTTDICLEGVFELRRGGHLSGVKRFSDRVETICRDLIEKVSWLAEPHYRLGRMYRALMKFEDAFRQQNLALQKNPQYKEALFERGILSFRKYRERISFLRQEWFRNQGDAVSGRQGVAVRQAPSSIELEDEEARNLKRASLSDLQGLDRRTAKALSKWLGGDQQGAQNLFHEALKQDPVPAEVYEFLGILAEVSGEWATALEYYTRGHESDKGYIPFIRRRAALRMQTGRLLSVIRGKDPVPDYRMALEDCDWLIEHDPQEVDHYMRRATILTNLGRHLSLKGKDPQGEYAGALASMKHVLKQDSENALAWETLATVRKSIGTWKVKKRLGGIDDLKQAEVDIGKAIELDGENSVPWQERGSIRIALAVAHQKTETGLRYLRLAIEDFGHALQLDPSQAYTWMERGNAYRNLSRSAHSQGDDPVPLYQLALEDFDEAVRLFPGLVECLLKRAHTRTDLAQVLLKQGKRPGELLSGTIEDASNILRLHGEVIDAYEVRGHAYHLQGAWEKALADWKIVYKKVPGSRSHLEPLMRDCMKRLEEREK